MPDVVMPKVVPQYTVQARTRIIDGAVAVLKRRGMSGSTMEDIAKEIGVSKGALYLYFPSKARLLEAILDRLRDDVLAKFEHVVDQEDVAEGIGRAVSSIFAGEFTPTAWNQLLAGSASEPEVRAALRRDHQRDARRMREFLRRLEARGRIPPLADPSATADVVLLLLQGSFVQAFQRGDSANGQRTLVRALRLVLGSTSRRQAGRRRPPPRGRT